MKLYHGSPKNLNVLKPHLAKGESSFEDQKAIFLTDNFNQAALYALGKSLKGKTSFALPPGKLVIVGDYTPKEEGYVYKVNVNAEKLENYQYKYNKPIKKFKQFKVNLKDYKSKILHVKSKEELMNLCNKKMKILLSADAHGEIPEINEKVDLILVAGDFARGNKLRKMIFEGGSEEEAKREIIDSSKIFLESLKKFKCPVVISLGNAEEWGKKEIIQLIKEYGFIYCEDKSVIVKGIRILGIDFFVEKWWANKYHPDNKHSKDRAIKDEKRINRIIKNTKKPDIVLTHVPLYHILDSDPNPPEFIKKWAGPCGSKILKEFVKNNKPKLVVCGHIHIPGEVKLGKTRVINPGICKIIEI